MGVLALLFLQAPVLPQTALEGLTILSQASATYSDPEVGPNGSPSSSRSLLSNIVMVFVAAEEAATLTPGRAVVREPGAIVAFTHRLANTGNVRSFYTFHFHNATDDDYDFESVSIYVTRDVNGNGVVDPGESKITSGSSVELNPGDFIDCVITVTVPSWAPENAAAGITIDAIHPSGSLGLSATDTVVCRRSGGGALLQLDKSASTTAAARGEEVRFTLNARNIGYGIPLGVPVLIDGQLHNQVIIRDAIPQHMTFSGRSGSSHDEILYHLRSEVSDSYRSVPPADLSQVDAVAFTIPFLAVGDSMEVAFKARVNDDATGTVTNTATVQYADGPAVTSTSSSPVPVRIRVRADINFKKSATPESPEQNQALTFILNGHNAGSGTASGIPVIVDGTPSSRVVVRDPIPVNTTFASFVSIGSSAPLYHRLGEPEHTYTQTAPADPTMIDAVAFLYGSMDPGVSFTLAFQVVVHTNAFGELPNVATLYGVDANGDIVQASNPVVPVVDLKNATIKGPTVEFYAAEDFRDLTRRARAGSPLNIQLNASAANLSSTKIEQRYVTITSTLTGDVETVLAVETGPNTGIFRIPRLRTDRWNGDATSHENGILTTLANDTIVARFLGIPGSAAATAAVADVDVDPSGIVFDSRTGNPVPGAIVSLVDLSGNSNSGDIGGLANVLKIDRQTRSPNPVTTLADGRFEFPLVAAGNYKVVVTAPEGYAFPSGVLPGALPAGHPIDNSGSYGGKFHVPVPVAGMATFDVPLDFEHNGALFVQKAASRTQVEVGETLDYTLRVKNASGKAITGVQLRDVLPAGFRLVKGSVRVGGAALPPSQIVPGAANLLTLPDMRDGETTTVTYRVQVGPGSLQGDGINRAHALATGPVPIESNVAAARVQVHEGVFTMKGVVIGKVFVDLNHNGIQDDVEAGVPGVRLFLEDGSFVITDGEGKFSFYGLRPQVHVLKVDPITLPRGASLAPFSTAHAGDGNSRFITLRAGELHKANFAIGNPTPAVLAEIKARREKGDPLAAELDRDAKAPLTPDGSLPLVSDAKSQPASGIVGGTAPGDRLPSPTGVPTPSLAPTNTPAREPMAPPAATPAPAPAPAPGATNSVAFSPVLPNGTLNAGNSDLPEPGVRVLPRVSLEQSITNVVDNSPDFLDLRDGDTLPYNQANLRIKGMVGAVINLQINGKPAAAKQLGRSVVYAPKQVEAREYVGVNLNTGTNELEIIQADGFGNVRARKLIHVVAPDKLAQIHVTVPGIDHPADGVTPVKVTVQLQDQKGVPVSARTQLTLESTLGRWDVEDLDRREPGIQVFLEGGRGVFNLIAPSESGNVHVIVSSGILRKETDVPFVPELRPMVMAGILQGTINISRLSSSSLIPARSRDGFEEELSSLDFSGDSASRAGGRAAFFLKGKIKGNYLLTAGFDSGKQTRERLFRDIQPDEFYPIYGDSSIRGFDAQSTGRLYVRIDKRRSYLLYGDFVTQSSTEARGLGNYNRSLTGIREHFELKNVSANLWASQDSSRQVVEELPANGTSGPYFFHTADGIVNSEQVEIITRDRHQPSTIIKSVPMTRFSDYEFEPFTGRILFRAPVASLDPNLNPIFIRVSYEVAQSKDRFWVYGGDAQVKVTDRVEVGGSAVSDENPRLPYRLYSANSTVDLGRKTYLMGEVAQSDSMGVLGQAGRVELRHNGSSTDARLYYGQTDGAFTNTGSIMNAGRTEGGLKVTQRINDKTRIVGQGIWTEDAYLGGLRRGLRADLQRSLGSHYKIEVGGRHSEETVQPASRSTWGATPLEVNSVRFRMTADVPKIPDASIYAEIENDVVQTENRMLALGGNYEIANQTRFYARHEFISALGGPFELNSLQQHNTTVAGLETDYMKDGRLFNEYRVRDAMNGRESEASTGLRNLWNLSEGLRMNTTLERVTPFYEHSQNEATAGSVALEYTRNPLWKGSGRLELRTSDANDSLLNTFGYARKLSRDMTFLSKTIVYRVDNKDAGTRDLLQARFQTGMAYRQTRTDRWHGLMKYEYKFEEGNPIVGADTTRNVHMLTLNGNYQPNRDWLLSMRYASKFVDEQGGTGETGFYHAHLVGGRVLYELTRRWDIGLGGSTMFSGRFREVQYAFGPEVGFTIKTNLRIALGYNILGFYDPDLSYENYSNPGFYVNLNLKFDETFLQSEKHD